MSFDVFINYSTKDAIAAKAACAAMEAARIRCWMAPRDIQPGAKWGASIVRAINQCRVMVLIFSGNANDSSQVQREVDQAFSKAKTVVPLRIEDVKPADDLAYYLNTVHWLDALTPPLERNLGKLVATVRALLSTTETPPRNPKLAVDELAIDDARAAEAQDEAHAIDERREKTDSARHSGESGEQEPQQAAAAQSAHAEAAQQKQRAKVEPNGFPARTAKARSKRRLALALGGTAAGLLLFIVFVPGFRTSPPRSPPVKTDESGPNATCNSRWVEPKLFHLVAAHYGIGDGISLYSDAAVDDGAYCTKTYYYDEVGKRRVGTVHYTISGRDNSSVTVAVTSWLN